MQSNFDVPEIILHLLQHQMNPDLKRRATCKKLLVKLNHIIKTTMITSVIKIWCHAEEIKNMRPEPIELMPKRCEEIIRNKGGHTNY